jgi:signal peptidase II
LKVKAWIPILLILGVLLLDQGLKFHIKTNYILETGSLLFGSEKFRIHFTENEGMAFGIEFGGRNGKLFLSLFRIIAVSFIGAYLWMLVKKNAPVGLLVSISLVFAGAMGNILDSIFYGIIFSQSSIHGPVAEFLPEAGGYAPIFYGKVVDMFYFPIWRGHYPPWLFDGRPFTFFQPVFNVADAAITIGVFSVLLFQREHFADSERPFSRNQPSATQTVNPETDPSAFPAPAGSSGSSGSAQDPGAASPEPDTDAADKRTVQ